ncbi:MULTISPECIES: hypothetical protein [Acidiphilium]|jgi:hypothetical protein|uniref:Uncharacterized protein n=1 Tax=Acidiphilium multivorum (strain DSM 11245 / JCM 8867 / NBRC 100883 / AIU 301) TaxID=926570 RepID=F0J3B5_ACIMA|nr:MULTISPECIES: hypothetical protein [Acidiphilium]MBU6356712.1 hypothetical protein [Rhodospirillales bacterium]KDM67925.1 hypothetical protein ACIDI_19c00070 [Acidiphilium sp. JA12-A1]MBS3024773.1 hypothetical protein [Acidiphilium multivorum]MDE2327548.1 hypothetical protein [Rhodospirillales bacterium]BAJ82061.1 hypothetical protein ACMV_27140 [Acidiphilium multivorum AIU301]
MFEFRKTNIEAEDRDVRFGRLAFGGPLRDKGYRGRETQMTMTMSTNSDLQRARR